MKKLTFLVLFQIIALCLSAQSLQGYQQYYFNGTAYSWANDVAQLTNGDFLFAGLPGLIKTDNKADKLWSKYYRISGNGIVFDKILAGTNNCAYILGNQNGIILCKTDSSGSISWAEKLTLSSGIKAKNIIKTYDNNLLITAIDSAKVLLIKTDTLGNVIWSKHFFGTYSNFQFDANTIELPDHSLTTIASIIDYPNAWTYYTLSHALIFNTDANGNISWSNAFGYYVPPYTIFNGGIIGGEIIFTSEKSYIISYTSSGSIGNGSNNCLAKLDSLGNFITGINTYSHVNIRLVSENPVGTINILQCGGSTYDVSFPIAPIFTKSNLLLDSIQSQEYYTPEGYSAFVFESAYQLPDRRYIFVGKTDEFNHFQPNYRVSILLTDSTGNDYCTIKNTSNVFYPDTTKIIHSVVLQISSGITVQPITITDTIVQLMHCDCDSLPVANFSYVYSGNTSTFTNLSLGATGYTWNFGDGTTSPLENPTHTYSDTLDHRVILFVLNNCGRDNIEDTISQTLITGMSKSFANKLIISPNPSSGLINITFTESIKDSRIDVINSFGQVVLSKNITNATLTTLDLSKFAKGMYIIKVQSWKGVLVSKVIIE